MTASSGVYTRTAARYVLIRAGKHELLKNPAVMRLFVADLRHKTWGDFAARSAAAMHDEGLAWAMAKIIVDPEPRLSARNFVSSLLSTGIWVQRAALSR